MLIFVNPDPSPADPEDKPAQDAPPEGDVVSAADVLPEADVVPETDVPSPAEGYEPL
ncbi:hypothetical protein ACWEPC_55150 [Nonomuraea sp. NPDC004297]